MEDRIGALLYSQSLQRQGNMLTHDDPPARNVIEPIKNFQHPKNRGFPPNVPGVGGAPRGRTTSVAFRQLFRLGYGPELNSDDILNLRLNSVYGRRHHNRNRLLSVFHKITARNVVM